LNYIKLLRYYIIIMEKDAFGLFRKKVKPEIDSVETMFRRQLSEEPEGLVGDLRKAETWYARLQTIMALSETYLDLAENARMPSKEKLTEMEREKLLTSRVASERFLRDRVAGLLEALKTRILLGQTLLNYYRDVHFSERGRPVQKQEHFK